MVHSLSEDPAQSEPFEEIEVNRIRFNSEQIIAMPREAEVRFAPGDETAGETCRRFTEECTPWRDPLRVSPQFP